LQKESRNKDTSRYQIGEPGILFLTSNRGSQFDDAILSRAHLNIEYENLTGEFRRDLWSTFLSKACTMKGPAVVEEHELQQLESLALYGREVGVRVTALPFTCQLIENQTKNITAIAHALEVTIVRGAVGECDFDLFSPG
jgi:hypothetical protein